ncbi:MAG: hypothetical protein M1812_006011 [Candelaria pacifica]|nr:MAG: hypothetical protein M1812_006011 [Candelaria pacifica]
MEILPPATLIWCRELMFYQQAGGSVGKFIAQELVKAGKHQVTALSRPNSTNKIPSGVDVKQINYDEPSTIIDALKGIEVLIITMAVTAPPETQQKLIEAAAAADVGFVLYNSWGIPVENSELGKDTYLGPPQVAARESIEKLGKSAWIGITCGFWYEFSLGGSGLRFGFDFPSKSVTLFDEGKVPINTSTWPQCGRAVTKLLSLPLQSDKGSPCLNDFKNKPVYISSFKIDQTDMLESVERVTGEKWEVKSEPVKERYAEGVKELRSGNRMGFSKLMYSRVFYPNGGGEYESEYGLHNDVLGLPVENLDEATRVAVENAKKEIAEQRYGLY